MCSADTLTSRLLAVAPTGRRPDVWSPPAGGKGTNEDPVNIHSKSPNHPWGGLKAGTPTESQLGPPPHPQGP